MSDRAALTTEAIELASVDFRVSDDHRGGRKDRRELLGRTKETFCDLCEFCG